MNSEPLSHHDVRRPSSVLPSNGRPEPALAGRAGLRAAPDDARGITTANYFPAGHRIRIEIAGSSSPVADRNWHAGGANEHETDGPIAHMS